MKNCIWKSCVRDCWLLTKNARKNVSKQCLAVAIRRTFGVDSWSWTKLWSTTTHQSRSSGRRLVKVRFVGWEGDGHSCFWDTQGIILINYLEKGKTITGAYCATLLDCVKYELKEKQPRLARKKECSFTRTTRRLSQRQNCTSCVSNYSSSSTLFPGLGSQEIFFFFWNIA